MAPDGTVVLVAARRLREAKWLGWLGLALGAGVGIIAFPLGWYRDVRYVDEAVHFATSTALGVLVAIYLPSSGRRRFDAAVAVTMVVTAGVIWELIEWRFLDLPKSPNDKADTLKDLCVDAAGGVLGAMIGSALRDRAELRAAHSAP